jgi:hypothetical protein
MIRKMVRAGKRSPRQRVPVTIINVKPYHVIMRGTSIICDGESGLPLVFDTFDLAEFCVLDRQITDCAITKMELEELARKCRDRAVPFDKFMLIDKMSQL